MEKKTSKNKKITAKGSAAKGGTVKKSSVQGGSAKGVSNKKSTAKYGAAKSGSAKGVGKYSSGKARIGRGGRTGRTGRSGGALGAVVTLLLVVAVAFGVWYFGDGNIPLWVQSPDGDIFYAGDGGNGTDDNDGGNNTVDLISLKGNFLLHVIDVGQGDAMLLETPDRKFALVDAGPNSAESALISYLEERKIKKFEYIFLTHPHEDHIGGADAVIGRYKVGATVMPAVTGTTVAFERVLSAIEANGCTLELAEVGAEYSLGDAKMTVLAPCGTDYDGMNNYSIVLRVDYGNVSFLLTGDAEVESEEEMCARHSPSLLDCDLLKIGHHGSSSSSSDSFLDAVSPAAVLISCGRDNNYGHPDESVTDRLTARGIPYYRTDELGDIVVRTDGRKIVVD